MYNKIPFGRFDLCRIICNKGNNFKFVFSWPEGNSRWVSKSAYTSLTIYLRHFHFVTMMLLFFSLDIISSFFTDNSYLSV